MTSRNKRETVPEQNDHVTRVVINLRLMMIHYIFDIVIFLGAG